MTPPFPGLKTENAYWNSLVRDRAWNPDTTHRDFKRTAPFYQSYYTLDYSLALF